VIAWQESAVGIPAFLSVITLLEIRVGVRQVEARDPAFAKLLDSWYRDRLLPRFLDRLLVVDQAVAEAAAELSSGRTLPAHDILIAATAQVHQLTVITRNLSDFADTGVAVVNPWNFSASAKD
jgi:toxin FitB